LERELPWGRPIAHTLRLYYCRFLLPLAAQAAEDIIIFHAGSLTVPFAAMEKAFEKANPGYDIKREAGGSTKMARMISELGKPADIMASADFMVINKTLMPKHADWNVRFATNQLVLCYTDKSKHAGKVNAENWYDILAERALSGATPTPTWTPAATAA
jgi:molybdate/tungstate transport system substrate-binding protein